MWNLRKSWKLLISFFFWLCETVLKLVAKCTIKCYCSYYNFCLEFQIFFFWCDSLFEGFFPRQSACAIPEKIRGLRIYSFENLPGVFIFYFTPGNSRQNKAQSLDIPQIVLDPLRFQGPKQRPLEISHYFFLVTLGNSASFLINPWKLHLLFLWYPWKFHFFNPTFWNFFWYSPIQNLR